MTLATVLSTLAAAAPAYVAGSIPFGVVLGRAVRGIDVRRHGSGNIGATNVFRVLGPGLGSLVFALDFLKGLVPVLLAPRMAGLAAGAEDAAAPVAAALAAAIAAVLGHVFPLFLGFKGGKGVATGAGALAALAPGATAIAFAVFGATVAATRYVSLGSILAAAALPAALVLLDPAAALGARAPVLVAASAIALVVIARHRANVGRLLAGTESRLGEAKPGSSGPTLPVGP